MKLDPSRDREKWPDIFVVEPITEDGQVGHMAPSRLDWTEFAVSVRVRPDALKVLRYYARGAVPYGLNDYVNGAISRALEKGMKKIEEDITKAIGQYLPPGSKEVPKK